MLCILLSGSTVFAQLTELQDGAYYRFVCVSDNNRALAASSTNNVAASVLNENDLAQIWQVSKVDGYYAFVNVANAQYLKGNSQSVSWGLSIDARKDENLFEFITAGTNNTIRSKAHNNAGYAYMHRDSGNDIVGWEPGAASSQWIVTSLNRNELGNLVTNETLQNLIANVEEFVEKNVDDTGKKVGYYTQSAVKDLNTLSISAKKIIENSGAIDEAYLDLLNEYNAVRENHYAKKIIIAGYKYSFENKNAGNYMSVNDEGKVITNTSAPEGETKNQWIIETGSAGGTFKIKNVGKNLYLQAVENKNGSDFTAAENPVDYVIKDAGNAYMAFATAAYPNYYMDRYNADRVSTWGTNISENASWRVTLIDNNDGVDLNQLIYTSERLIEKVAVFEDRSLELQTTDATAPYYLYCNAPYTASKNGDYSPAESGYNLLDDNTGTHLHTVWSGNSADRENHYLRVDLGENNNPVAFSFKYATARRGNSDMPSEMLVQGGSSENGEYATLATLTKDDENPLPTQLNTVSWYNSAQMVTDGYRYLRFMVTKNGREGKDSNGHYFFTMSEFAVNAMFVKMCDAYSSVDVSLVQNLYFAVSEAIALLSSSYTELQLNAAKDKLNNAYNNLLNEVNTVDNASKVKLQALIDKTSALIDEVGIGNLNLTTDNFYCNAPYTGGNVDNSVEYVTKLTDGDNSTYLHTRWDANSEDGEYHYLRVDAGNEGVDNFYFSYVTSSRGKRDMPAEIVVEGSDDMETDYTTIATLGEDVLPQYLNQYTYYQSPNISTDKKYRYIRFKVTKIGVSESDGNGHPFFTLSEFRFYNLKVRSEYAETITDELLINTINTVKNVKIKLESNLIAGEYDRLSQAYNALYNALSASVSSRLPVELTTDVSNPVVYNIIIARTNHYNPSALQFDLSTGKVAVKQQNKNNLFQGWYFMLGNEGKVKIYPYLGEGKLLGTNDNENGKGKVLAIDESADGYGYEWNITKLDGQDWCNISISIGSTFNYFSHFGGGVNDMMGFYSDNNTSDAGSRFKFEKLENIGYNAVTEVEIKKNTGTGLAVGGWKNSWTSNAVDGITAPVVLGVTANNITIKNDDDYLRLYVGQASPSTYTITPAAGYYIESYSFKFVKDGKYDGNVNLIADGKTYNATAEEQIVESTVPLIEPYSNNTAEFKMSGSNNGIKVYDFKVKIRPILTTFVTYNYVLNGTVLGSEKLECAVGGNYPAPKLFPVKAPEGCVVGLETVNVNCVAEIELGTSLTDVWNVGLWNELNQIPAGITENVKLPGDVTIASAHYMTLGVDVKSAGYLQVNFNNHKGGNNRLDIIGVDLLNSNGEVVVSDYHFGYKGTYNEKNIYSLNVANAGVYTLRYIVSFQKEENSSNGEIAVNLYNRLTAESGFKYNWKPNLWIELAADNIPEYIKNNVTVQNGTAVTRDVKYVENYIYAEAGILEATFIYKGGNNRLDIVGVDLFDVYGNAIESSNDYHFGYSGGAKVDNTYSFLVAKSGFYKLRYIVCHISEALTSNGEVNNVLYNAYNVFKSVWDRTEEICTNNVSGTVGHYTDASMNKLYELYEVYKDYSPETSVADLFAAKTELENALAALKINMPQKDNFYAFVSASTQNYCSGKYVHTNVGAVERQGNGQKVVYNHTHLLFDAYDEIVNKSLTMFTFTPVEGSDNKFKVKNLHTGMYVKSFGGTHMGSAEEANNVTIESYSYPKVVLTTGSYYMHAQQTGGVIVVWNKDSEASLWKIVRVNPSIANYTASIGNARWSTLCLNYAVTVPEGVTAYAATGVAGNEITLESVGKVIPAGTPVLLNLNEGVETGKFTFEYVNETPASISDNKLQGTFYDSYIEYDGGHEYYVLAQIDGKVGFAKIKRDYNGEGSKIGQDNGGTHFKNNANRVYLPIVKDLNPVQSYGVRIVDGTTGIDTIVTDGVAPEAIYDLSGRRVKEITLPGIYIVNGKKYIKK